MEIKVLGGGCKSCEKMLKFTKEAVSELGIDAQVQYITDMDQIMQAGVMSTPALIIDGVIKSTGRVVKTKEIKKMIEG
ncbi:MAG: thioredoxin family protein [Clostridia bacterium]|jgi:small redox-active disulfide protein 2|nr:thioredoxin family protein [Clostridia bacterium]MBT7121716.1 thioredoxin family protein [Clostridia bacterium]